VRAASTTVVIEAAVTGGRPATMERRDRSGMSTS